ncbi:MAG: family 78 glycoside hydrolase catalytic domain [Anaerolineae bacterium]
MHPELTLTDLSCEYQTNPLGLDVLTPHLSWKIVSTARNVRQRAYQIQVARGAAEFGDCAWDSGVVTGEESIHVPYAGPALTPRTRYYYRVQIWDETGHASGWSDPSWFETGLMDSANWQAQWIASQPPDAVNQDAPCPMLRTAFTAKAGITSARVYASALGLYELHLNGVKVGADLLTPGWTAYQARVQYQTYDVTSMLHPGTNALGALLGRGWYAGYFGLGENKNNYGNQPALIAQLHITYADGGEEVVVTDSGWRTAPSPILMSEFYHGETYDARLETPGWDTDDCDDSAWGKVSLIDYPLANLVAQQNLPPRALETIQPVALIHTPAGETVLDFGQNMVGWVRFAVNAASGSQVVLKHAEVLDAAGNFYTENMRAARNTITYTCKGGGLETYEPRFTHQGFRFVKVDTWPGEPQLADFTGVVIYSDMPQTGDFTCSNPLVNRLQENIRWSQKGNFVDVPTDCPQRDERLGWTGDAQVFARTACFNMDTALFYRKWLADLAIEQAPNGAVPNVIPDVLKNIFGPPSSACGWADAAVIIPWTLYLCYGDARILRAQYASMKAHVEYIRAVAEGGLLWNSGFHFGDWLALDAKEGSYFGATPNDLSATAYYAYSTDLLARAAKVLGKEDDAALYSDLHGRIVAAFQNEFITPSGRLAAPTQTAHVLALMFNLMQEHDRPRLVNTLVKMLEQNRWHLNTGFLGTPYLCLALSANGRSDVAYKLLLQSDFPSWLYQVTAGATTIWEHWDGIKPDGTMWSKDMNSFNHYSYGAVGDWLYRVVAGIEIDMRSPAYQHSLIHPQPNRALNWAQASHETPYGKLSSKWDLTGGEMRVELTIPANTTASVVLPYASLEGMTESGTAVQQAAGLGNLQAIDEGVAGELGSGSYYFRYPLSADAVPDVPADPPKRPF